MSKLCPYCGTPLKETTHGRWLCPNHGIIEEIKSENLENSENKKRSYLG